MGDILRKTEVSFVCILQTLWQCQVRIETTVPMFVIIRLKKGGRQVTEKPFASK